LGSERVEITSSLDGAIITFGSRSGCSFARFVCTACDIGLVDEERKKEEDEEEEEEDEVNGKGIRKIICI
jgi:hypothetical protein